MNLDAHPILVHAYVPSEGQHSPSALLDIGHSLVHSAVDQEGWYTVQYNWDSTKICTRGSIYNYAFPPPTVDRGKYSPVVYPEWGAVLETDESEFSLSSLQDFESTNLDHLFVCQRSEVLEHIQPASPTPSQKRRKLHFSILHGVIPQPHYYQARLFAHKVIPNPLLKPFRRADPQPIAPYTSLTIREYLEAPYTQSTWIVPIRGVLPWHGCSSAMVLESSTKDEPHSPDLPLLNREITWTHASIKEFWSFLLAVRDASTLGPLALSFHTSSISDQTRGAIPESARVSSLLDVDHIKVYHDAACAMLIRNIFDAWSFPTEVTNKGRNDISTEPKKVRVLRGARLVLLDARFNGVLIS